ncbi:MAG TPA: hypothetical protein VF210_17360 [Pseudomonadales bacterium]
MKRRLIALIVAWLLPLTAAAATAGPMAEGAGVIQELDFAGSTMVIDGMSYEVAIDTRVEIGGSYGAFTMLQPGMRVYYEFERHSPTLRIIRLIRELPRDVVLDQH